MSHFNTRIHGLLVNYEEMRLEWTTSTLTKNVHHIFGALIRDLDIKFVGEPHLGEDGETWYQKFKFKERKK